MKTKSIIIPVILAGLLMCLLYSCKKEESKTIPTVTITTVSNVTATSAISGGEVTTEGGDPVIIRGVCWSLGQNPTIANNRSSSGTGKGSFTINLTGLGAGYTYYLRAYATNSIGTAYSSQLSLTTIFADFDGNIYTTVNIGSQVWMVENLKVTHYRNGDPIPIVTDAGAWNTQTSGAYCWYNNNDAYKNTYGPLYSGFAVSDSRKIAPNGWHVAIGSDIAKLRDYLGSGAGGKLKQTGTSNWLSPNTGANNETGFTALPGGYRHGNGTFIGMGWYGSFWTSTLPTVFYLEYSSDNFISGSSLTSNYGNSVRCIKD